MVTVAAPTELIPQRLKMSYAEYLEFASDSSIMEWVEGEVIIYMPPVDRHQELVLFLSKLLHSFIQFFNLGTLRFAPLEVKLWPDGPSREPDIIFIGHQNLSKLTAKKFEGGPDLVVEIISENSAYRDMVQKRRLYEKFGVKEYWIVIPKEDLVEIYTLKGNVFQSYKTFHKDTVLESPYLKDLKINLQVIF